MILAVRDKFCHWVQVHGSLYLPDTLSHTCLRYCLTLAGLSVVVLQHQLDQQLLSYLRDYRLFIIYGAYQHFTKARTISPAEYILYHSLVITLYQSLLSVLLRQTLYPWGINLVSHMREMTTETITCSKTNCLIQDGCLKHFLLRLLVNPHFLVYVSVFRAVVAKY